MRLKITIVLSFFLCINTLSAPAQESRNQQVKALNLYVNYLNECIHALWIQRNKLRNFNRNLNTYTRLEYAFDRGNYWTKNFESFRETLRNTRYFRPSAQQIQDSLFRHNLLKPSLQSRLQSPFQEFVEGIEQMNSYSDSIDQYLEKKEYLQDDSLRRGYALVETFARLYDEIDVLKDTLVESIEKIYRDNFWAEQALLGEGYRQWREFLMEARAVCNAIRYQDSSKIDLKAALERMEAQLKVLEENQLKLIEGTKRYGLNNGRDPEFRFRFCLRDAQAILSHMRNYIKAPAKNQQYRVHGREYFYYNERFLNKMNRYGLGLGQ
ncbi:MAG: hypothetical protein AAFU64_16545, partial [Bacteroidota bacterium]